MAFSQIIQVFSALCFIVGILLLSYWIAKKFFIPWQTINNKGDIKVLETKMILPKKYISIVRIKDKILAIAIADNSMTLLSELDPKSFDSNGEDKTNNIKAINFRDHLKRFYKAKTS